MCFLSVGARREDGRASGIQKQESDRVSVEAGENTMAWSEGRCRREPAETGRKQQTGSRVGAAGEEPGVGAAACALAPGRHFLLGSWSPP